MPIEKFSELLSPAELKKCNTSPQKSWFTLPTKVFTSFIFRQEISAGGEEAMRIYEESTPVVDRTEEGLVVAMRANINERTKALRIKLGKLTTVANPNLGLEWLQDICFLSSEQIIHALFINNMLFDYSLS